MAVKVLCVDMSGVSWEFSLWARKLHLKAATRGLSHSHLGACLVSGSLIEWPFSYCQQAKLVGYPNI